MSKTATLNPSPPDRTRIENRKSKDIDTSDIPPVTDEMFATGRVREPTPGPHSFRVFRTDPVTGEEITVREGIYERSTVTLEVEPEILAWFNAQGDEADAKMRAALRIYARAHQ